LEFGISTVTLADGVGAGDGLEKAVLAGVGELPGEGVTVGVTVGELERGLAWFVVVFINNETLHSLSR
jgi:hypothetical protein